MFEYRSKKDIAKIKELESQVLIQQNWKEHYAARAMELEAKLAERGKVIEDIRYLFPDELAEIEEAHEQS